MTRKRLFEVIVVLILLLILFVTGVNCVAGDTGGAGIAAEPYITIDVQRVDGSTQHYDSNYFEKSDKGDRLSVKISLPKEQQIANSVLLGSVYQCAVKLSYQDEILYSYGWEEADKGRAIGNVLVCADVPDEAWGHELLMECLVTDYTDFSKLDGMVICEAKNRTQYLLKNHTAAYLLSTTILIVFSVIFFVLVFWRNGGGIRNQGIYLSVFCVGLMLWQMGYERMFYVIFNNIAFCGIMEYVGIFFAPAPFCMFLCYVEPNRLFQRIMKILAGALTVFFVIITVLNFTTAEYHYCRYLKVVHGFIAVIAVVTLLEFILVRCGNDNKRLLIRFAILMYVVFALSDMLLFYVNKSSTIQMGTASETITSLGLYVFLLVMLISYVLHVLEHVVSVKEKKRLEKMAYQDGMTGVANRRSCLDYIEELKGREDYTIFFFDVNNLKTANDEYGHDMGDHLILAVAQAISVVFVNEGFCGRYGGDEFIAVVEYSQPESIRQLERRIGEEIVRINAEKQLPVPVEVAYGCASSTEKKGAGVEEIIRLADERMYECKRKMKQKS